MSDKTTYVNIHDLPIDIGQYCIASLSEIDLNQEEFSNLKEETQKRLISKEVYDKKIKSNLDIKLTVCVMTVPRRIDNVFIKLIKELERQVGDRTDVEILGLYDNKLQPTGSKRNRLINIARGKFIVFIDDDDSIAEDYISSITESIVQYPDVDCILFDFLTTNKVSGEKILGSCSIKYNYYKQEGTFWFGKPFHIMAWRTELARKHAYKDITINGDINWSSRAYYDIKKEARINKTLYYVNFDENSSESRGKNEDDMVTI